MFDCAFKPANGVRSIPWRAHVSMMAAAQPFLSGAISKTVNMPSDSTPEDIAEAYRWGWELGLEGVGHLSRRIEAEPAAVNHQSKGQGRRSQVPHGRDASGCLTRGNRSLTSSTSMATKVTSPSDCTTTGGRASCSSRWPRKAAPSAA